MDAPVPFRFFIPGLLVIALTSGHSQQVRNDVLWQRLQKSPPADYATLITWQSQWRQSGLPADSVYGALLLHLATSASERANDSASLRHAVEARQLFERPDRDTHPSSLPRVHFLLGKSYFFLNQYQLAQPHFEWLLRRPYRPAERTWHRTSHHRLAHIFRAQGDYEIALRHDESGLALARMGPDSLPLINLLLDKAFTLQGQQLYSAALESVQEATLLADRFGITKARVSSAESMAIIYTKQRRPTEAIRCYERNIRLCREYQLPVGASILANLGFVYYDLLRDYDRSLVYYHQALATERDPYQKSRMLNLIGAAHWRKKAFVSAIESYQQALKILPLGFLPRGLTANPSPKIVRQAARKEYLLTLIQDKADTWLAWANASGNRAYLHHALATYRTADQMIDFMRWEHTGEESKRFWREKTHRLYENAIETCYRLNRPEDAFYFFEKSRAALLSDRLNELGASQLLAPADQKREAHLQKTVSELRQKVSEVKAGEKSGDSLRQSLLTAEETQTAFVRSLETRNPAYFRYRYDTSAVRLQTVREKLLTEGQTLLEYFVGDSVVYALTVTATTAKLTQLNVKNYTQTTRQLLTLSADAAALNQRFPEFLKTSHQLFGQLFAPLGVPKGRVIVSPDGAILPLELLSRSPNRPDWLLGDYAFSYTYSAQFLIKQASRKSLVSGSFLGLAPVSFASGQPTLGGSDASLTTLGGGFFSPTLLSGSAATKRAFLRELPRHRVAQLYAHAQADSSGREPEIFFADSSLRASELSGLGLLPTQLVVLSACQTGVGQTKRGEGVFSLARSLALAGVPSTVTTLWRVDNVATYRLTELFFEKIGEGLPADEALQQAKLAYLAAAPSSRAFPPFWAGMVLIGSAAPLERGTSPWVWVGGSVVLLGLGVWGWRRQWSKPPPPASLRA